MTLSHHQLKDIARQLKVTDHGSSRTFLNLLYIEAKAQDPTFSFVKLSEILGIGSANVHSLINGRRPLTLKAAGKICEALGLVGVQRRYFLSLVQQERAKTEPEREAAIAARLALQQRVLPTELERRQLEFFSHWYHAAVLECLRLESASDQAEWLAAQIRPEVPLNNIIESLRLLNDLGYVRYDSQRQRLYPTDQTITTGNEVLGLALQSYHREMLKLSLGALEHVDAAERDISALTLAVSSELKAEMKQELIQLRKRFLEQAGTETAATEVVQLNMQLFPLQIRKG